MMKRREFLKILLLGAATAGAPASALSKENGIREFHIKLNRYRFTPSVINVRKGDWVRLIIEGMDIEHGLYIDGYNIGVKVRHAEVKVLEFIANQTGAHRIRCSVVCGPLHPFMTGKLVVEPNNRFLVSAALSLVTPFAALILMHILNKRNEDGN